VVCLKLGLPPKYRWLLLFDHHWIIMLIDFLGYAVCLHVFFGQPPVAVWQLYSLLWKIGYLLTQTHTHAYIYNIINWHAWWNININWSIYWDIMSIIIIIDDLLILYFHGDFPWPCRSSIQHECWSWPGMIVAGHRWPLLCLEPLEPLDPLVWGF
jgi:hypothetical protein